MRFLPLTSLDRRIGLSLVIASLFAIGLLCTRILYTDRSTYLFLVWNLFLAWIPVVCAWLVTHTEKPPSAWKLIWLPALLWLLFFPNSPYILTDLGHLARLSEWVIAPLGYDVVMLLTFTLNGLLLGFVSLFLMEKVWRQHMKPMYATALSLISLLLAGFGMYLGRFLRWNSWDIFHRPGVLLNDLVVRLTDPLSHPRTWGFTALYAGFLIAIYLIVRLWKGEKARS
ncbi:DUF1361 domain-containing protein [Patescibacteria group bacterium]|nr:DUF1361 domain-containing protein [Patescibacteria group bacterium]